jgi:predicted RNA binding protein YcfA (HicA-like mRNA interferase family)
VKLPILSAKGVCAFLEKEGFPLIRRRGSQRFYEHRDGRTTVVPMHANKDISRGLPAAILEQIELDRETFLIKIR